MEGEMEERWKCNREGCGGRTGRQGRGRGGSDMIAHCGCARFRDRIDSQMKPIVEYQGWAVVELPIS